MWEYSLHRDGKWKELMDLKSCNDSEVRTGRYLRQDLTDQKVRRPCTCPLAQDNLQSIESDGSYTLGWQVTRCGYELLGERQMLPHGKTPEPRGKNRLTRWHILGTYD